MPNIIDEIIKLLCSKYEEEIWEAAHSLTPQPLIENGTIPIKFRKIDINKSLKYKMLLNAKIWKNSDKEKNICERKL